MSQSSLYVAIALFLLVASWFVLPLRWMALLSFLARRLTGFKAHDVTVDGVRWHYLEGGKGTTLVILHGLAAEADHWLGVAGPLRHDHHVLVPDLPGFGKSQPPAGLDFRIGEQAQRLGAWLDQLGVETCILAGNSMGAWIAANYAASHPERVRGLWLQDAFGMMSATQSEIMTEYLEGGTNPFKVETMKDYANLVDLMFVKRPHVPYALARAGFLNTARLKDELPRMQNEFLRQSIPLEELAPRLTMPVLIEWGEGDRATHPDGARALHALIPGSTLVTHPEVGHLPMLETPTLVAQTFQDFARKNALV
jgi:triacylglycerol lipase